MSITKKIFCKFLALSFIILVSCQNNNIKPKNESEESGNISLSATQLTLQNPNNPYNYVGVSHNNALDAIHSYLDNNLSDSAPDTVVAKTTGQAIADWLNSNDSTKNHTDFFKQELQPSNGYYNENTLSHYIGQDKDNGVLSETQESYLIDIDQAISNSTDTLDLYGQLNTITQNAKNELSDQNAKPVLVTSSVARYSYTYWSKESNRSKWNNINPPDIDPIEDPKQIIKADVKGAVVGFVGGFFTGPGVGISALGGGLSNSAGAAVDKYWDDIKDFGEKIWNGIKDFFVGG